MAVQAGIKAGRDPSSGSTQFAPGNFSPVDPGDMTNKLTPAVPGTSGPFIPSNVSPQLPGGLISEPAPATPYTPVAPLVPAAPLTPAVPVAPAPAPTGLAVSGNVVDTGRYIISGSNNYSRPTDGGQVKDGMLSIYDKQTKSYVDVYGDPHVYTSAGDQAKFMSDGMTLTLGDGTKVEIEPTTMKNGVSYIGEVAITKGNQTVVQSGFEGGTVATSAIAQGGPSTAQGFNNAKDAVLSAGTDGSLGTLFGPSGTALNSKTTQQSLDGMFTAPGASSPATAKEVAALQQLISTLQQQVSATGGSANSQQMISGMEQLVSSLLSGGSADMATMNNTLLPSLEQTLGQLGASGQGASVEASQITQVISAMMDSVGAGGATPAGSTGPATPAVALPQGPGTSPSYNPSDGISGAEIDAMLASAGGGGPAFSFTQWDQAAANYIAAEPKSAAPQSSASASGTPT